MMGNRTHGRIESISACCKTLNNLVYLDAQQRYEHNKHNVSETLGGGKLAIQNCVQNIRIL
jgi:hypothetical protein